MNFSFVALRYAGCKGSRQLLEKLCAEEEDQGGPSPGAVRSSLTTIRELIPSFLERFAQRKEGQLFSPLPGGQSLRDALLGLMPLPPFSLQSAQMVQMELAKDHDISAAKALGTLHLVGYKPGFWQDLGP